MTTHQIWVPDDTGHTVVAEWTIDAAEAVAEAERVFADLRRSGRMLTAVEKPGEATQLLAFDPTATTIIAVAPLVGG